MALRAGYVGVKRWLYEKLNKQCDATTKSLSDLWVNTGILGTKNLLKNTGTTEEKNGVTYTFNSDGTVSLSGTAEANQTKKIGSFTFKAGVGYILTGCPSGGTALTGYWLAGYSGQTIKIQDIGKGDLKTFSEDTTVDIYIRIPNGQNTAGMVFKPMIRLANDPLGDYQPYAMTNQQLTQMMTGVIKSDSFSGTTSASGNILLSSGTSRLVIAAQTDGKIIVPYSTGGTPSNQNGHVSDFTGAAIVSTAVSGTYYYIDAPAVLTRSAAPDTRTLEEVEEPAAVIKTTRTKKTVKEEE